ncbi:5-(carboxyamino)imidazole ribonucleotide synthase [Apibacter raozihei]|uniref:5-(carboxyamino)imidazole ribonucleotide synthase n=1 Tax=Apibacter raozihei TaxID=2500547 RepID=UPI000FE3CDC5|nr:5-(carboxyamino)imidazole ribonucleotide synthase [Apibacter raozihei]
MKIGILGGGQLGRMFMQNAMNYPYEIFFLEPDISGPCSIFKNYFTQGDFKDYHTVLEFGKDKDVVSIEIENVNVEALRELEKQGKIVIPGPNCLEIIKDKGLQKNFYKENHLPTANFFLIDNKDELTPSSAISYPFVQKLRVGGYDGKGVQVIKNEEEMNKMWDEPSVIEEVADIAKELSVIVSKNANGEVKVFDVVEMVFDQKLNLVDYLFSPADLDKDLAHKAKDISLKAVEAFHTPGIFCVELFLLKNNEILINEIAPRVHNSGHQTIEANYSSQYDQMLRVLTNLPLGDIATKEYAAMVNLIGESGYEGEVLYQGLDIIVKLSGVYIHLYGKKITKPGRKMGHVTVVGISKDEIENKIQEIKSNVKVISK